MEIRAKTKIVGQPKAKPGWTLERAALINKQQRTLAEVEQRRRADVTRAADSGRNQMREEMARWALADGDFRKYFVRSAADRLGRQYGDAIADWTRTRIDPTLAERKRLHDHLLNVVAIDAHIEPSMSLMKATEEMIVRVEFPRGDFHFAGDVRSMP
jgi:hypothetical protein